MMISSIGVLNTTERQATLALLGLCGEPEDGNVSGDTMQLEKAQPQSEQQREEVDVKPDKEAPQEQEPEEAENKAPQQETEDVNDEDDDEVLEVDKDEERSSVVEQPSPHPEEGKNDDHAEPEEDEQFDEEDDNGVVDKNHKTSVEVAVSVDQMSLLARSPSPSPTAHGLQRSPSLSRHRRTASSSCATSTGAVHVRIPKKRKDFSAVAEGQFDDAPDVTPIVIPAARRPLLTPPPTFYHPPGSAAAAAAGWCRTMDGFGSTAPLQLDVLQTSPNFYHAPGAAEAAFWGRTMDGFGSDARDFLSRLMAQHYGGGGGGIPGQMMMAQHLPPGMRPLASTYQPPQHHSSTATGGLMSTSSSPKQNLPPPLLPTPLSASESQPEDIPSMDPQQRQQLYEQQQRRHHVEAMLRAHLALQQLPPPPGRQLPHPTAMSSLLQHHLEQHSTTPFLQPHHLPHPPPPPAHGGVHPREMGFDPGLGRTGPPIVSPHLPRPEPLSTSVGGGEPSAVGAAGRGGGSISDSLTAETAFMAAAHKEFLHEKLRQDQEQRLAQLVAKAANATATMEDNVKALRQKVPTHAMMPPTKIPSSSTKKARPRPGLTRPSSSSSPVTEQPPKQHQEANEEQDIEHEGHEQEQEPPKQIPLGSGDSTATFTLNDKVDSTNTDHRRTASTKLRYQVYTPPKAWSELAMVPKMDPTPPDDNMEFPVEAHQIKPQDVLLGRGGMTNTHLGNIKFRELVAKYRMAYCTAPKGDKGALARYLCNFVRSKHGRFLRKEEPNGEWFEVGDEKAVGKCGQALREGTAALIRRAFTDDDKDATGAGVTSYEQATYGGGGGAAAAAASSNVSVEDGAGSHLYDHPAGDSTDEEDSKDGSRRSKRPKTSL
jgi:hypothetical protein